MSIKCGWASIDERGKAKGGKAGDQTGKEVKVGDWYYFGQTVVIRWIDRKKASLYSNIITAFCRNSHIGYDQADRATLYNALKKADWKSSGVTYNVETDCSETVVCGVNCTVGKGLLSSALYTGNLSQGLMATGLFKKYTGAKYCKSPDYLMKGDILIKPNGHVISVLEDGKYAGVKSSTDKKDAVALPVLRKGSTGSQVKKLQGNLNHVGIRVGGEKLELDGSFGSLTRSAVKLFQKKAFPNNSKEWDGSYGQRTYKQMLKYYN